MLCFAESEKETRNHMWAQNILQSMGQNIPGIMENGVTLQQNMKHLYPRAVRYWGLLVHKELKNPPYADILRKCMDQVIILTLTLQTFIIMSNLTYV